jgi:hypothetical protein
MQGSHPNPRDYLEARFGAQILVQHHDIGLRGSDEIQRIGHLRAFADQM